MKNENKTKEMLIAELNEEKFRYYFEFSNIGMGIVSLDEHFIKVNQKMSQIFGYSQEELENKTIADITPPEDMEISRKIIQDSISGISEENTFEKRYIRKDGKIIWGRAKTSLFRDAEGKPLYFFSQLEDITEHKHTEKALQESENRLRQMAEHIREVFFLQQLKPHAILYVNSFYEEIWGRSCQSLYDNPQEWLDSIHPEDSPRIREALKKNHKTGKFHAEYKIIQPNGNIRWVSHRSFPIPDESGQVYRAVGIVEDITEKKHLEEQLQQSQKMQSLGTLAGGIAHEFNNILCMMQGFGELLLEELPEDSIEKTYMKKIYNSGERATKLVRQILTFGRLKQQQYERHHLQPLIQDALKMMRSTLPVTIDIQQDIDPACSPILADPNQIHQALINLCTNAFHAMEATGGVLTIRLKEEYCEANHPFSPRKAGLYLKLTVSDTGCGIPLENQEKIFDPFFTTKEVGKGTGLGLSVVHSIIEQHQGTISVESKMKPMALSSPEELRNDGNPGGTTFQIYLPVAKGDVKIEKEEEIVLTPGTGHILVVDDEVALTEFYQQTLQGTGYEVTTFNNELDALTMFQENPEQFDVVLTDYTMPHLTGDLFSLQLLETRPDIPIILATGYHSAISKERATSLGISEFVMKPIRSKELVQIVQKLIE